MNVGLAADIGTLQRFPKIIGNDSKARELALSARKFGAVEAKEIGVKYWLSAHDEAKKSRGIGTKCLTSTRYDAQEVMKMLRDARASGKGARTRTEVVYLRAGEKKKLVARRLQALAATATSAAD